MKFYTVYKTVNKENGKCYIGKHITDNPYDGYLGSGKNLQRAIKKYGIESFEKFVLYIFDNKKDMDNKEIELVNEDIVKDKETYNIKLGGDGGWDYVNETGLAKSKEHFKIATEVRMFKYKDKIKEWTKKGYKNGLYKWITSNDPIIKKKRSEISKNAFKGKHHSEETKKIMSDSQKGKHIGDKNSQYGKCWIHNDEKSIMIKKEVLDIYLNQGWIKGRKLIF